MKSDRKRLMSEPSETRLDVSESCVQSCLGAIQLHGARGYIVESGLEKQLRDALANGIATLQKEDKPNP